MEKKLKEFFIDNIINFLKYFIGSFTDSLILVITFSIIYFLVGEINTKCILCSILLYFVIRENILLLKYQNKKKDNKVILIIIKTDSSSIFKLIKSELKEKVNKLFENQTENLSIKFIDDYAYSQRVANIKNSKNLERIYGFPIYTVLTVNETTKKGKTIWSLTPTVKINSKEIKDNKEVQVDSEEYFKNIGAIDADNSFYGIQDLSISIFLAFSYIFGLYIPTALENTDNFAIAQEIFNNAMKECQRQKNITKRKEKIRMFDRYEQRFRRFRNTAIQFRLRSMLEYKELERKIKFQKKKDFNKIFNFKEIEELLTIWDRTEVFKVPSFYSLSETFGFFKKEPKYKMNLIFNEHYTCIKKRNLSFDEQMTYYFNIGFYSLYSGEYESAFYNYKVIKNNIMSQEIEPEKLILLIKEIHNFFKFVKYEEDNYIFDIADFMVELVCKGSEIDKKYNKLVSSEKYAQMPSILRIQFENFYNNSISKDNDVINV